MLWLLAILAQVGRLDSNFGFKLTLLQASLATDWAKLGPSWGQVGAKLGQVGAKFGCKLGQVGAKFGRKLGQVWAELGQVGPKLDQNEATREPEAKYQTAFWVPGSWNWSQPGHVWTFFTPQNLLRFLSENSQNLLGILSDNARIFLGKFSEF